jgi:multidrug resistance efflux pump
MWQPVKSDCPAPIPIPFQRRWRDVRVRFFPLILLAAALAGTAVLWEKQGGAATFVGQAEPVLANVSSYKAGVIAALNVSRFQRVKAGDLLGQVTIAEPQMLTASLAVIQSEIDMLRADLKPVVSQQRTAIKYDQLRLNWMRRRAQLASAKVDLRVAQDDYRRMQALFKDKVVSEQALEQAKGAQDRLQSETDELTKLASEAEESFHSMQLTNAPEVAKVSIDPLSAAIGVQESKLRLTEAEMAPIPLRASIDGMVTVIHHRSGEAVTAGEPILGIATLEAVRIVAYMRPPILGNPKPGMAVEIRTRGFPRQIGTARIVQVGTQFETVPTALLGPAKYANTEMGLPVDLSVPPLLRVRPGELLDVRLVSKLN